MADSAMDSTNILARLTKLERQNRRLRIGLVAVAVGAGAALLTGAALRPGKGTVADVVTAHKFVLLDDSGRPRASLFLAGKPENPRFSMYDAIGNRTIMLDGEGRGMEFVGDEGKPTVLLAGGGGFTGLGLYDEKGLPRILITATKRDTPSTAGKGAPSVPPTSASLSIFDQDGSRRLGLEILNTGWPVLSMGDNSGRVVILNPASIEMFTKPGLDQEIILGSENDNIVIGNSTQQMPNGNTVTTPASSITAWRQGRAFRQWP